MSREYDQIVDHYLERRRHQRSWAAQPRAPKGDPDGGQWVAMAAGSVKSGMQVKTKDGAFVAGPIKPRPGGRIDLGGIRPGGSVLDIDDEDNVFHPTPQSKVKVWATMQPASVKDLRVGDVFAVNSGPSAAKGTDTESEVLEITHTAVGTSKIKSKAGHGGVSSHVVLSGSKIYVRKP